MKGVGHGEKRGIEERAVDSQYHRTIAACMYTPACKGRWVEFMSSNQYQPMLQVLDILQNTLDQELLERVLMLSAILICIYLYIFSFIYFIFYFIY